MKKSYEAPVAEVVDFTSEDVLTISGCIDIGDIDIDVGINVDVGVIEWFKEHWRGIGNP